MAPISVMPMSETRSALISGGGPGGLAAALLLLDRGWQEIILVERQASPIEFDKNKAFNYLVDARGKRVLQRLGIAHLLDDYGVPVNDYTQTTIKPDGSSKISTPPLFDADRQTCHWTTRRNLLEMLHAVVLERNDGRIKLLYDHSVKGFLNAEKASPAIVVTSRDGVESQFSPQLVLACDGLKSAVRQALETLETFPPDHFEMIETPSASTGIYYKVINLPARFRIKGDANDVHDHHMSYAIMSRHKGIRDAMAFFAFPVCNPTHPRNVCITRSSNHRLWDISSGEELLDYLQDSFPQLDIRELISKEEANDVASMQHGEFPAPQYAKHLHAELGSGEHKLQCLLIGDAAHAFPPDLGLGVNSALEDLYFFDQCLDSSKGQVSKACGDYEAMRLPENKSLIWLVKTVFPYQYNHVPWRLNLWIVGFASHLMLRKLMPRFVDKPGFHLLHNHMNSYQEVERRIRKTARLFRTLGIASAAVIVTLCYYILLT